MAKVLLIVPNLNFRDEELKEIKEGLTEQGHDFVIAGIEHGEAIGMIHERFPIDRTVEEVSVDEFDGIILIGGIGTRQLLYQTTLLELLREAQATGKLVGSIGMGVLVLAQAGILQGKKVSGAIEDLVRLQDKGAVLSRDPVTLDGTVLTGLGHEVMGQYVERLLSLL